MNKYIYIFVYVDIENIKMDNNLDIYSKQYI